MKKAEQWQSPYSERQVTGESVYRGRREFMRQAGILCMGALVPRMLLADSATDCADPTDGPFTRDQANSYKQIATYNNYYEFTTNKEHVHLYAADFNPSPWELVIDGEVEKPLTLDLDQIARRFPTSERIHKLRCVEGWSMIIPWQGFSLCELIKQANPTADARYVEFVSVHRPAEMIGQRRDDLAWPYREALRMDEAMHPLTTIATGLYGKPLPNQNGAPLRLVVPWKYGFKSIKAINRIHLRKEQPTSTWMQASPENYGFYANVNPEVSTTQWSQRREVLIGELRKQRTQLFNGYQQQVAHLYRGLDLKTHY